MIRMTFPVVEAGMSEGMRRGRAARPRDGRAGEAVATRRDPQGTEMGEGTCSGPATLYGGAV